MEPEKKLIDAVRQRDLELVKKFILEGENVNQQDGQGWTALHWAAGAGDAGALRLLLEKHADITARGRDNRTPLMVACAAGQSEAVKVLTESEKAAGVWKDPRESRPYCKGFYLKDLQGFAQWMPDNTAASNTADAIVYIHQDFTVTRSVWPNEDVIFNKITPEWIHYCESQLRFSIPADLVSFGAE